jgi:hypothetical protein
MAEKNHKDCECPIMDRVISLEMSRDRHNLTLYGDDEKPGVVGNQRIINWKLNLIITGIAAIAVVLATAFANGLYRAATAPSQSVNQSISTPGGDASTADTYSTADLSVKMGLSVREIQDRASKGELPGAFKDGKAWRFDRAAVDAALAAKAAGAAVAAKDGK